MLKKLTLQGFKSFADKTELEFPSKITAVVGPNGSGKSNIVDAIRWVLGEQSLKNIRLGKSEDVIFAGTPGRNASGFADVRLYFDNSEHIFPADFEELSVGRKLYRDGTSNYFINNEEVLLKDVVRLMAGAKLGTKGLAIVTQGAGDAFLTSQPKDRREMLEEVLGLKEYRIKKEEAERKMEETKRNLERAADLIQELEPHLRSLKRQVSRWEKRQEKVEALKTIEERYFHHRLNFILRSSETLRDTETLQKEISELGEKVASLEARTKELEKGFEGSREERGELDARVSGLEKERAEILRKLGNIEGKLEALHAANLPPTEIPARRLLDILRMVRSRISRILEYADWEAAKKELESLQSELDKEMNEAPPKTKSDMERAFEKERTELLRALELTEEAIGRAAEEARAKAAILDKFTEEFRNLFGALEEARAELREKQSLMQEYTLEAEKRRLQENDLKARMEEAGWDYEEFRRTHSEIEPPSAEDIAELEARMYRVRRELADIGSVDEELVKEYHAANERHQFLVSQKSDAEKALEDLEGIAAELRKKIDEEFSRSLKSISAEFQRFFRLIFGGGSARIRELHPKSIKLKESAENLMPPGKEDEEAIQEVPEPEETESGIDIEVNLPRKKIKSLDMLSGGERALTSIALIFAVIWISSPPFLILDEIDAPLDESNSERFSKLLKELATKTQFILITHNRTTMEAADVLYGVTMQDGISKVFSLKFTEAQELASHDVHAA